MNSREIILDILLELSKGNEYSNILIAAVLEKYDYIDSREKAFIKRVSEGCIERRIQLDYVLDQYSKVPVRKMKPLIRELLRMSTYQLLFMEHVPDPAVCNEAVKLAKKRKFQSLQGYVNGVLRNIARGKEELKYPDREKERTEYLSVCYSMPLWLVKHLLSAYGEDVCETILTSYLQRQPVSIRLDERMSREEQKALIDSWKKKGVEAVRHPYLPYAVTVQGMDGVRKLDGYDKGQFAVQDVSSMLVVEAADIKDGDTVIDICAAPGGKALHAAVKAGPAGQVIACDVTEYKTERIEENRERLRLDNVSVYIKDGRQPETSFIGKADVLIADVPCSGLGVIGKKQDIKYRVTEESITEIVRLQKEIMQNAVTYVKPGGVLMYSTCTINMAENEDMVRWLCSEFGFTPEDMAANMPEVLKKEAEKGYLQLLPGIHQTDGFFMAKLRKNETETC
jgi:16S rRNA (cytosine967-C5)-methyltransferase